MEQNEDYDLSKVSTIALMRLHGGLQEQMNEIQGEMDLVKAELHGRVDKEGSVQEDKDGKPKEDGSKNWEYWDPEDKMTWKASRTWTSRISWMKKAGEILEEAGLWDVYKEKALDDAKVKALRKAGEISDAVWSKLIQQDENGEPKLGYFTLKLMNIPFNEDSDGPF